ncbi:MAG TPA: hypothetical protein VM307_06855 [Egibacteraceae bacterium]|nr:hypothetical protein [Egibacteraceae bacterium]
MPHWIIECQVCGAPFEREQTEAPTRALVGLHARPGTAGSACAGSGQLTVVVAKAEDYRATA